MATAAAGFGALGAWLQSESRRVEPQLVETGVPVVLQRHPKQYGHSLIPEHIRRAVEQVHLSERMSYGGLLVPTGPPPHPQHPACPSSLVTSTSEPDVDTLLAHCLPRTTAVHVPNGLSQPVWQCAALTTTADRQQQPPQFTPAREHHGLAFVRPQKESHVVPLRQPIPRTQHQATIQLHEHAEPQRLAADLDSHPELMRGIPSTSHTEATTPCLTELPALPSQALTDVLQSEGQSQQSVSQPTTTSMVVPMNAAASQGININESNPVAVVSSSYRSAPESSMSAALHYLPAAGMATAAAGALLVATPAVLAAGSAAAVTAATAAVAPTAATAAMAAGTASSAVVVSLLPSAAAVAMTVAGSSLGMMRSWWGSRSSHAKAAPTYKAEIDQSDTSTIPVTASDCLEATAQSVVVSVDAPFTDEDPFARIQSARTGAEQTATSATPTAPPAPGSQSAAAAASVEMPAHVSMPVTANPAVSCRSVHVPAATILPQAPLMQPQQAQAAEPQAVQLHAATAQSQQQQPCPVQQPQSAPGEPEELQSPVLLSCPPQPDAIATAVIITDQFQVHATHCPVDNTDLPVMTIASTYPIGLTVPLITEASHISSDTATDAAFGLTPPYTTLVPISSSTGKDDMPVITTQDAQLCSFTKPHIAADNQASNATTDRLFFGGDAILTAWGTALSINTQAASSSSALTDSDVSAPGSDAASSHVSGGQDDHQHMFRLHAQEWDAHHEADEGGLHHVEAAMHAWVHHDSEPGQAFPRPCKATISSLGSPTQTFDQPMSPPAETSPELAPANQPVVAASFYQPAPPAQDRAMEPQQPHPAREQSSLQLPSEAETLLMHHHSCPTAVTVLDIAEAKVVEARPRPQATFEDGFAQLTVASITRQKAVSTIITTQPDITATPIPDPAITAQTFTTCNPCSPLVSPVISPSAPLPAPCHTKAALCSHQSHKDIYLLPMTTTTPATSPFTVALKTSSKTTTNESVASKAQEVSMPSWANWVLSMLRPTTLDVANYQLPDFVVKHEELMVSSSCQDSGSHALPDHVSVLEQLLHSDAQFMPKSNSHPLPDFVTAGEQLQTAGSNCRSSINHQLPDHGNQLSTLIAQRRALRGLLPLNKLPDVVVAQLCQWQLDRTARRLSTTSLTTHLSSGINAAHENGYEAEGLPCGGQVKLSHTTSQPSLRAYALPECVLVQLESYKAAHADVIESGGRLASHSLPECVLVQLVDWLDEEANNADVVQEEDEQKEVTARSHGSRGFELRPHDLGADEFELDNEEEEGGAGGASNTSSGCASFSDGKSQSNVCMVPPLLPSMACSIPVSCNQQQQLEVQPRGFSRRRTAPGAMMTAAAECAHVGLDARGIPVSAHAVVVGRRHSAGSHRHRHTSCVKPGPVIPGVGVMTGAQHSPRVLERFRPLTNVRTPQQHQAASMAENSANNYHRPLQPMPTATEIQAMNLSTLNNAKQSLKRVSTPASDPFEPPAMRKGLSCLDGDAHGDGTGSSGSDVAQRRTPCPLHSVATPGILTLDSPTSQGSSIGDAFLPLPPDVADHIMALLSGGSSVEKDTGLDQPGYTGSERLWQQLAAPMMEWGMRPVGAEAVWDANGRTTVFHMLPGNHELGARTMRHTIMKDSSTWQVPCQWIHVDHVIDLNSLWKEGNNCLGTRSCSSSIHGRSDGEHHVQPEDQAIHLARVLMVNTGAAQSALVDLPGNCLGARLMLLPAGALCLPLTTQPSVKIIPAAQTPDKNISTTPAVGTPSSATSPSAMLISRSAYVDIPILGRKCSAGHIVHVQHDNNHQHLHEQQDRNLQVPSIQRSCSQPAADSLATAPGTVLVSACTSTPRATDGCVISTDHKGITRVRLMLEPLSAVLLVAAHYPEVNRQHSTPSCDVHMHGHAQGHGLELPPQLEEPNCDDMCMERESDRFDMMMRPIAAPRAVACRARRQPGGEGRRVRRDSMMCVMPGQIRALVERFESSYVDGMEVPGAEAFGPLERLPALAPAAVKTAPSACQTTSAVPGRKMPIHATHTRLSTAHTSTPSAAVQDHDTKAVRRSTTVPVIPGPHRSYSGVQNQQPPINHTFYRMSSLENRHSHATTSNAIQPSWMPTPAGQPILDNIQDSAHQSQIPLRGTSDVLPSPGSSRHTSTSRNSASRRESCDTHPAFGNLTPCSVSNSGRAPAPRTSDTAAKRWRL